MLVGLGHHRLREHREDRTARKREDEGDGIGRRVLEEPYPASEASPEITAIAIHIQRMRDFCQPLVARPEVEEIDSGRLEMKTAAR